MGLSSSCLRGPKDAGPKTKLGDERFGQPVLKAPQGVEHGPADSLVVVVPQAAAGVPTVKGAGAGSASCTHSSGAATKTDNHGAAICSSAVCLQHGDSVVNTSFTGTLSAFSSAQGYPHSLELGPPSTDDEQTRVQALRALDVLDSVSHGKRARLDEEADLLLSSIMAMFRASTAMLVFFEDSRIIIRNSLGIIPPGEFPYKWSFCAYTLTKQRPQTLMVPDATRDVRFADNPFVLGAPHIRFYCGAPLVSSSGHILGTICFADTAPRPGFDAGQCTLLNNMAELMVRQMERYRPHAGPTGQNDAETTALAHVARTLDCYEVVTGMVDVSLADGWMVMYANEAWEQLCAPLPRKQLVGRPLQRLLALEADDAPEPEAPEYPVPSGPHRKGDIVAESLTLTADNNDFRQQHRALQQLQVQDEEQQDSTGDADAESDTEVEGGVVVGEAAPDEAAPAPAAEAAAAGECPSACGLRPMPAAARREWRRRQERQRVPARERWARVAAALRTGAEVEVGLVRLLLEDGRPSDTVMCMSVRSANCHILDAASRMPVGVPPQTALPHSILASAANPGSTQPPLSPCPAAATAAAATREDTVSGAFGSGTSSTDVCNEEPGSGNGGGGSNSSSAVAGPLYCFVSLLPAALLPACEDADACDCVAETERPDTESDNAEAAADVSLIPSHKSTPSASTSDAAIAGARAGAGPAVGTTLGRGASFGAGFGAAPNTPPRTSRLSIDSHAPARSSAAAAAPGAPNCASSFTAARSCGGDHTTGGGGGGINQGRQTHSSKLAVLRQGVEFGLPSAAPSASACNSGSLFVGPSSSGGGGRHKSNNPWSPASVRGSAGSRGGGGGGSAFTTGSRHMRGTGSMQTDMGAGANWLYGMEPFPGLQLGHLLGKGGYGRVFAASYNGRRVAAKVVSNSMLRTARVVNGVTLEALLAQELDHPYIVRTFKCVVRYYDNLSNGGTITGLPSRMASSAMTDLQPPRGTSQLSVTSTTGMLTTAAVAAASASASAAGMTAASTATGTVGGMGSAAFLPGTPSQMSVLPYGPSEGAMSVVQPPPPPVPSPVPVAAAASGTWHAAAGCSGGGGQGSGNGNSAVGGNVEGQQPKGEDFDSFDVGGEETSSGMCMIDHLAAQPCPPPPGLPSFQAASQSQSQASTATWALRSATTNNITTATGAGTGMGMITGHATGLNGRPSLDASAAAFGGGAGGGYGAAAAVFGSAAAAAAAAAAPSQRGGCGGYEGEALPEGETWILQEFCTGGTLQDAIETGRLRTEPSRVRGLPHLPAILLTATEIATAMHCLHSRGYMHGDLSAVNVLLAETPVVAPGGAAAAAAAGSDTAPGMSRGWVAKVSDFGLAKHLPDPNTPYISSTYGVITHCAPETLKHYTQTQKSDSCSFGVLLWQMFTGSRPWANMNRFQVLGAVTSGTGPGLRFLPSQSPPPRYSDLTFRCLDRDPAARPTFAEICEELRLMTLEEATAALQQQLQQQK